MKCTILKLYNICGRTDGFGSTSKHPPVKPNPKSKPKSKPKSRTTAKPLTKQKVRGADQEPGPLKRLAGHAVVKPSKRKKVENEVVLESEDDEMEEPGGGSDKELKKAQVKEARVITKDVISSSGEDEMRIGADEHLNTNDTKSRGRVDGRTQIQHGNLQSSKQSQKASKVMKVRASQEENTAEDVAHIEVSPPHQIRLRKDAFEKTKATGGRGRGQVKRSTTDIDEILQDGIADLMRRPDVASSKTSGASNAKDTELTRLKEKIGWVSDVSAFGTS